MIGHPRESHQPGEQQEFTLRKLDDLDIGLGTQAQHFYAWADAWVKAEISARGEVWTDDLNLAAKAAHMEPPDDSFFGRFWSGRGRVLGIVRTPVERTNRNPESNGRKARKWVAG